MRCIVPRSGTSAVAVVERVALFLLGDGQARPRDRLEAAQTDRLPRRFAQGVASGLDLGPGAFDLGQQGSIVSGEDDAVVLLAGLLGGVERLGLWLGRADRHLLFGQS